MDDQNTVYIERIFSYLDRKKEYLEKILRLTQKQDEAIKTDNVKDLTLIITEKESYINHIKRLDTLNTKLQEEIESNRELIRRNERLNSLREQLQSIITRIMNHDHNSINLLYSSIDITKAKLDNLNRKKRSQISMKTHRISAPSFVDVLR